MPKPLLYACAAGMAAFAVYNIWQGTYGAAIVLMGVAVLYGFWAGRERRSPQVVLKISKERLWTRHGGNKSWDSIMCIRFRFEGRSQFFMDIYRSNDVVSDEEISLHGTNISMWRLKRILKKYVVVENH